MSSFITPTLLVSKCLHHEPCRYDGSSAPSSAVDDLAPYVTYKTYCPEQEIGLPTPRPTLRLVAHHDEKEPHLMMCKTGEDYTKAMEDYISETLETLKSQPLHGIILKSRSPSCGLKDAKLYKDLEKGQALAKNLNGLFADALSRAYPYLPIEHEGRLTNYNIRELFYTRIFAHSALHHIRVHGSMKELIDFHSSYKYLLMAYSPGYLKKMGKVVANTDELSFVDRTILYEELLHRALSNVAKPMRNVNMLLHLFGYFSKELSSKEKAYFLDVLEDYSEKRVPFSVPLSIIYAQVVRFEQSYLLDQKIFHPFPQDLVRVTDSGKGRMS